MNRTQKKMKQIPVICLHGHGQKGETFRAKTGSVRSSLKKICDFHYVDGPFVVPPCAHSAEEARSWVRMDCFEKEPGTLRELETRLEETGGFRGVEESFRAIARKIREVQQETRLEGGEDKQKVGLVGFSLGAAVLASFLAKVILGNVVDEDDDYTVTIDDLGFVAFFSGFIPSGDSDLVECLQSKEVRERFPRDLPSYHCFGLKDEVVTPDRPAELASLCVGKKFGIVQDETDSGDYRLEINPPDDAFVFAHKGGHFVPSQAKSSFTAFVRQFA